MKGTRRNRRYIAASIAALGATAAFATSAHAVPTPTTIPLPNADSRPEGITRGADGSIWYADFGGQAIVKTTGGPGVPFGVPNDGPGVGVVDVQGPADITPAPVGTDLWFGADNATVGKITAAGAIVGFDLGTPGVSVRGITAAGGNLWFVGRGTADILRSISPGGAFTPAIDVTAFGAPEAITAGPAGDTNVYFTTLSGQIVKKNTATGDAPALVTAVGGGAANGITLGPDGNLWVTNGAAGGAGQVSKISTAPGVGVLQSFPVGAVPKGITSGSDGALWFTEAGSNSVGRVSTSGAVTSVPLTGCIAPEDIAAAADGALWVTCFGNNAIVRIVDSVAPPGPGPAPGPGPVTPPVANLKGSFSFAKGRVFAGKLFTVKVNFNKALTKSRVRVQIKSVNTKRKGAIKSFKTIGSKLVTGKKASLAVKIAKPGAYFLRITFQNGPKTVNVKPVKVTVRPRVVRTR